MRQLTSVGGIGFTVLAVASIVGAFLLLVMVPQRLLGMRFGIVRTLAAGLAGYAISTPISRAFAGQFRHGP